MARRSRGGTTGQHAAACWRRSWSSTSGSSRAAPGSIRIGCGASWACQRSIRSTRRRRRLPPCRWCGWRRVDAAKLADDELLTGYRRAVSFGAQAAVERFGREMIARETLAGREERLSLPAALPDDRRPGRSPANGRVRAAGGPPGRWLMRRLGPLGAPDAVRTDGGGEIDRLIDHIHGRHGTEPGILQRLALADADGRAPPRWNPRCTAVGRQKRQPDRRPRRQGGDSGRLWTPTALRVAEARSRSSWTPGMDSTADRFANTRFAARSNRFAGGMLPCIGLGYDHRVSSQPTSTKEPAR